MEDFSPVVSSSVCPALEVTLLPVHRELSSIHRERRRRAGRFFLHGEKITCPGLKRIYWAATGDTERLSSAVWRSTEEQQGERLISFPPIHSSPTGAPERVNFWSSSSDARRVGGQKKCASWLERESISRLFWEQMLIFFLVIFYLLSFSILPFFFFCAWECPH